MSGSMYTNLQDEWPPKVPGLIEAFEFDNEGFIDFYYGFQLRTTWCTVFSPAICCALCGLGFYACGPVKQNLEDQARSRWIAVTEDGIVYKTRKRKAGCRWDCQDIGATSRFIPFDKIQDIVITEPAGSTGPLCCMIPRILNKVEFQTAAIQAPGQDAEICAYGLKDAHKLRTIVLDYKRGRFREGPKQEAFQAPPPGARAPIPPPSYEVSAEQKQRFDEAIGVGKQLVDLTKENMRMQAEILQLLKAQAQQGTADAPRATLGGI